MANNFSHSGRDEATGCSFNVSVSPSEEVFPFSVDGHELYVELTCLFLSPSEGPIPDTNHEMSWWSLQDPDPVLALEGNISRWLDDEGIPLTARNDTVRLILDSISVGEPVDGVIVRIEMNYSGHDREGEGEELERVITELSMQEDSLRPTPASREAVEALERVLVRAAEREISCCAVCLEEFSLGLEVTKMPCSHVFHGDCIVKWLEVQRFCLLCRFELPCAEESIECAEYNLPNGAIMETFRFDL